MRGTPIRRGPSGLTGRSCPVPLGAVARVAAVAGLALAGWLVTLALGHAASAEVGGGHRAERALADGLAASAAADDLADLDGLDGLTDLAERPSHRPEAHLSGLSRNGTSHAPADRPKPGGATSASRAASHLVRVAQRPVREIERRVRAPRKIASGLTAPVVREVAGAGRAPSAPKLPSIPALADGLGRGLAGVAGLGDPATAPLRQAVLPPGGLFEVSPGQYSLVRLPEGNVPPGALSARDHAVASLARPSAHGPLPGLRNASAAHPGDRSPGASARHGRHVPEPFRPARPDGADSAVLAGAHHADPALGTIFTAGAAGASASRAMPGRRDVPRERAAASRPSVVPD